MNTIKVKNYNNVVEEATTSAAILPGSLCTIAANDTVGLAAADAVGPKIIAVEDEFQGKAVTDTYASGDSAQVWIPSSGDIALMIASAAISKGALVAGAASGKIVTRTTEVDIVGQALEAAAADGDLIMVRIK